MNNILFNLFLYFKFYFCTSDATSNHTQSQSISIVATQLEQKIITCIL